MRGGAIIPAVEVIGWAGIHALCVGFTVRRIVTSLGFGRALRAKVHDIVETLDPRERRIEVGIVRIRRVVGSAGVSRRVRCLAARLNTGARGIDDALIRRKLLVPAGLR